LDGIVSTTSPLRKPATPPPATPSSWPCCVTTAPPNRDHLGKENAISRDRFYVSSPLAGKLLQNGRLNTQQVIDAATARLQGLDGHVFDVLSVSKPVSVEAAVNLAKVISKLSPLLGNMIEFNTVEVLNAAKMFRKFGK